MSVSGIAARRALAASLLALAAVGCGSDEELAHEPEPMPELTRNDLFSAVDPRIEAIVSGLLSPSRLGRLFDGEVLLGDKAYTPVELVDDLQAGIFSELKAAEPKVDPIRRALQRNYVDILKGEFTSSSGGGSVSGPRGATLCADGGRCRVLQDERAFHFHGLIQFSEHRVARQINDVRARDDPQEVRVRLMHRF